MNAALPVAPTLRIDPDAMPVDRHAAGGTSTSGVSWGAIFAGAAAAAALSLILLILGVGLGLSSVSPWARQGLGATALTGSSIAWLTFTQLAASGMGGYLAGRLRTKWLAVHTDEVYFRDTAHGFLAWSVATLITAALLTSSVASIVGTGLQAGATAAGTAATGVAATGAAAAAAGTRSGNASSSSSEAMGMGYAIDTLFRKQPAGDGTAPASDGANDSANGSSAAANSNAEVTRIFANGLRGGSLAADDSKYVGQLIAQRAGLSQADAEKRVSDAFIKVQTTLKDAETAARDAADKARKAAAYTALWLFVSLLVGAFVASLCATFGGRRRDA